MMTKFTIVVLAGLLMSVLSVQVRASDEQRIALVIGNGDYRSAPLRNPVNDATLMSETLTELGFDVSLHTDAGRRDMRRAIADFGKKLEDAHGNAIALIYYAGHGVQIDGENYLIPVDAEIFEALDVKIEGIQASAMLDAMAWTDSRMNIVILDACRNNPFVTVSRTSGGGLARMDAPTGTLLAYSTAPGMVAEDGTGRNSPYTQALARAMKEEGRKIEDVFKRVRVSVLDRTNERQVPWESSSLVGDFYFAGPPPDGQQVASLPEPAVDPAPFISTDIDAAMADPVPPPGGIRALMPMHTEEPETRPLPIDGVWRLSLTNTRVRIRNGRSWAIDGYPTHLVMAVHPGQVLTRNLKPDGDGGYTGEDLPSVSQLQMKLQPDMTLAASIGPITGPIDFFLTPIAIDDPVAFRVELEKARGN
ncbi:MAG: caspase family protein [Alphaproteobacteria bacterium]